MAERVTFTGLRPEAVRANLDRVRERIGAAGGDPERVAICAATKYVPVEELPPLAEAGIELIGENRAQDLIAKQEAHGDRFTWDFIGALQSRKVKHVAPRVRLIHSLASESARSQLERHPARAEDSRPYFARLAELAAEHGLRELSMGTTQDFEVAVAEGATIVRLGTVLYE